MSKADEIILDVIPIYIGKKYPTKDIIWHFKAEIKSDVNRIYTLNRMMEEIKYKFSGCNTIIIVEKGKVIEVL